MVTTYEFQAEGGVNCGGCNWEASRLYVRAESREEADRLLHNTYGCSGCGKLEWEHGTLIGFFGPERETAEPKFTKGMDGACEDFSPNSDEAMDGGGLCGECYAGLQADDPRREEAAQVLIDALRPLAELLDDLPNDSEVYVKVQLYSWEWAAIMDALAALKLRETAQ